MEFNEIDSNVLKTLSSSFKGVVFYQLYEIMFWNKQSFKKFTFKVCKENLFDNEIVFYYRKDFFLVEVIDEKLGRLKAGGLIEFWIDQYIKQHYMNVGQLNTGPSELKIEHLSGLFVVWIIGLHFALIVFFSELVYEKLKCKFMLLAISTFHK